MFLSSLGWNGTCPFPPSPIRVSLRADACVSPRHVGYPDDTRVSACTRVPPLTSADAHRIFPLEGEVNAGYATRLSKKHIFPKRRG